ncbi:MAG: restriction endonuclease subunit S [Butyrivibrio sp.]|jgi:type I restriction enzyme S subunit|nr:restriction endonuclease subunit S [Butyrivibrio sp.]
MILADDLRKAVLQAAIQGKLVEQRTEEGTGEELYAKIQEEKDELIKQGKIKKEKALPEITDEEIPFDIPENWKWVRIGEIGELSTGTTPKTSHPEYFENGQLPFITPGDISYGGEINYDTEKKITETGKQVARLLDAGSVLQVCIGGSIGKCTITERDVSFNQQINAISPFICDSRYIKAVLTNTYTITWMKARAGSTATPILNKGKWANIVVPLPPIEEQHRITSKLEAVILELDNYANAEQKLISLQNDFPDDMRKSILQYAMQGRLVEQRSEEGTGEELYQKIQVEKAELIKGGKLKKEKALAEITEDEIPFDIPDSWKWVKFGELSELISGSDLKPEKYNNKGEGIPYITGASNINDDGTIIINRWVKEPNNIAVCGDLLMTCKGTVGKMAVLKEDKVHIARQIMSVRVLPKMSRDYMQVCLLNYVALLNRKAKSIIPGIERKNVLNLMIPLPPIEEQCRIVEKLNQILPHVNDLKEAI